MKIENIKELLNEFYNGNTTLEQEQELFRFFNSENVPDELIDEADIFLSLYKGDDIVIPEDLDLNLSILIDKLDSDKNNIPKEISFYNDNKPNESHNPPQKTISLFNRQWIKIASIAASFTLIFTISLYLYNNENQMTDTYTDPELAYAEAQKALSLVATNLNEGFEQIETAESNLGKANKILNEQINKISK